MHGQPTQSHGLKISFSCFPVSLQKPGMDVADAYVTFVRHSQDVLRDKVNEEMYIERLFDVSKCLLLLAAQGGEPPKCDKIRDRRISHILRTWIGPDSNRIFSSPPALGSYLSCVCSEPAPVWPGLSPSPCDTEGGAQPLSKQARAARSGPGSSL